MGHLETSTWVSSNRKMLLWCFFLYSVSNLFAKLAILKPLNVDAGFIASLYVNEAAILGQAELPCKQIEVNGDAVGFFRL